MYTTLNACRSYLYGTARAVDRNIVSNKVRKRNFYLHLIKIRVEFRIVLVLYCIVLRKLLNYVLMGYKSLVVMDILMITQQVVFYVMRNCTKLALVQVKFDAFLLGEQLMRNMV